MNLPIYIRKFWIQRHNRQAEEEEREMAGANEGNKVGGVQLNGYARLEQANQLNGGIYPRHFSVSGIYK